MLRERKREKRKKRHKKLKKVNHFEITYRNMEDLGCAPSGGRNVF